MKIKISKPNDTSEYYETEITASDFIIRREETQIGYLRYAKDPVHAGITEFWQVALSNNNRRYRPAFTAPSGAFNGVVKIGECPVILEKRKNRYYINGKAENLASICSALARLTYRSCFEKDPIKLLSGLYSTLAIPENIKYCLENRMPYFFYDDYEKFNVRLNVQMIGDKEVAIEIADGVWGTISIKGMDKMCAFYVHGKKRSKLKFISPKNLYKMTMDKEPSSSEIKVMLEFLKQNRMKDIVETRALELVNDLLLQHGSRLKADYDEDGLKSIYIHGKHFDWKLTNNNYKSDIQMVSTYIWQPSVNHIDEFDEEGEKTGETTEHGDGEWKGPICIDNMAQGSPLGDQFATRALALLNDSFTITIVNTIRRYIIAEPNEYRVDFDEM